MTQAEQPWALVTVRTPSGTRAAVLDGGRVYAPAGWSGMAGVMDLLRRWPDHVDELRAWTPDEAEVLDDARVLNPLQFPAKVLCSGPNFYDHLAEMGQSSLGEEWVPYFFFKPPTTSMVGDGEPVLIGGADDERVDWEGELAVVIGVGGRDIDEAEVTGHLAGYAVSNDISLRGPHHRNTPAAPFEWDWIASKAADTSLPIGPGVVPAWLVPDPQDLRIVTTVNGEVMQDGTTASMVCDVAQLVAQASRVLTLEAGDVILTGTPAGVGAGRGIFLAVGDKVEVSIPGVGSISNPIVQRERPRQEGRRHP